MTPPLGRAWWLLLAVALVSSATVIAAAFRYVPIQVDGGWASYGAFAITQDREPYLHQGLLEEQEGVPGVKALFIFDTVSNTRALYTSLWFRLVGPSWRTIKALGILEFVALILVAWVFFRRLLPSPELALLATALLVTDKMMVLMTASTFRPDVSQAALACLFYLLLRHARPTVPATLGIAAFAALAGVFSATAVTPVALATTLRGAEVLVGEREERGRRLGQVAVAILVAAACYGLRQSIFPLLLGAERAVMEPASPGPRIAQTWSGGLGAVLGKEVIRWNRYFVGINGPLLLALIVAAAAWALPGDRSREALRRGAGAFTGALAGVMLLLLLDPHPRPQHLAPALPFLLLLLGHVDDVTPRVRRAVLGALAAIVVLASGAGLYVARRTVVDARAAGFSNAWLQDTLAELTPTDRPLVVVGGTEYWSYWDPAADVTIVDYARNASTLDLLGPLLERLDFAVLSADYQPGVWLADLERIHGIRLRMVADKRPYVVIADGFPRPGAAGGSPPEPLP